MAYNTDNEIRENLVEVTKNNRGDMIVASSIKNKNTGNVSIDIRKFYTGEDDELKPTSKGVRFSSENLLELIKGLVKALEPDEKMDLEEMLKEDDTEDEYEEEEENLE